MTYKDIKKLRDQSVIDNNRKGNKSSLAIHFSQNDWDIVYKKLQSHNLSYSAYFKALLHKYKVFTLLDELIVPLRQRNIVVPDFTPIYKQSKGRHTVHLNSYHLSILSDRLKKVGFASPLDLFLRGKL